MEQGNYRGGLIVTEYKRIQLAGKESSNITMYKNKLGMFMLRVSIIDQNVIGSLEAVEQKVIANVADFIIPKLITTGYVSADGSGGKFMVRVTLDINGAIIVENRSGANKQNVNDVYITLSGFCNV